MALVIAWVNFSGMSSPKKLRKGIAVFELNVVKLIKEVPVIRKKRGKIYTKDTKYKGISSKIKVIFKCIISGWGGWRFIMSVIRIVIEIGVIYIFIVSKWLGYCCKVI